MSFIRALDEAGKVRFYFDFRTGCALDLSSDNRSYTIASTPRITQTADGSAFDGVGSGFFSLDPTGMRPSAYGTGIFFLVDGVTTWLPTGAAKSLVSGSGTTNRLMLYWTGGTALRAYDGTNSSLSSAECAADFLQKKRRFAGATFGGGVVSDFFVDGTRYAGSNVLQYSGDPLVVYLCGTNPGTRFLSAIAIDMNGITDADIARLHRELADAPGIVRRARKAFSLPHPTMSPAEYAAENILFDLKGDLISGKMPDMASALYPATVTGSPDVVLDGPFSRGLRMEAGTVGTLPAGANAQCFQGTYTVEAWVKVHNLKIATEVLLANASANYVGRDSAAPRVSHYDGGAVQRATIASASLVANKAQHLVYTFSVSGPFVIVAMYVDGQYRGGSAWPTGFTPTTATVRVNSFNAGSLYFESDVYQLKYYKGRALTGPEVRERYLLGARKCMLDAWVHSDGSCPVSLADRSSGEVADGWKITRGSVRVVEDAASPLAPGARWIRRVSTCTLARRSLMAFGSWHVRARTNLAGALDVMLLASNDREYLFGSNNGYMLELSNDDVYLFRITASATSTMFSSLNSIVADTAYEFWITRDSVGVFAIWIKGGAYTTWTLMTPSAGTNPTIADMTHVSSSYITLAGNSIHEWGGVRVFLGEMTPDEAIAAGVLEP